MQNGKIETFMSVLSILTVVLTAIGLTFAYFSVQANNGNVANGVITTARVGNIIFSDGSTFNTSSDIVPDWNESKDITLIIPAMFVNQEIYINLDYENDMPELTYRIDVKDIKIDDVSVGTTSSLVTSDFSSNGSGTTSTSSGVRTLDSSGTSQSIRLVKVNTIASNSAIAITYTYKMELPETGVNQDENQDKNFEGTLSAALSNTVTYYNDANPSGTTTQPSAIN